MSPIDEVRPLLKRLKMSGILDSLQLRVEQAVEDKSSYPEFLLRIMHDEVERRDAKMLMTRLRRANFEHQRTLEDFDFSFNPQIDKHRVIDLATCAFIRAKRNALLLGDTGTGKSHLAQAIGHRACMQGMSVLFLPAQKFFSAMRASRADERYDAALVKFTRPDLLILDDLGVRELSGEEPLDLYELIRTRYEHGSMLMTSNRSTDEWASLFHDPLVASAAMDRLLHNATVLLFEGPSYRNPGKRSRSRGSN